MNIITVAANDPKLKFFNLWSAIGPNFKLVIDDTTVPFDEYAYMSIFEYTGVQIADQIADVFSRTTLNTAYVFSDLDPNDFSDLEKITEFIDAVEKEKVSGTVIFFFRR